MSLVEYRTEGAVAVLELNDPPANTYTYEMMRELDENILKARFDDKDGGLEKEAVEFIACLKEKGLVAE